MGLLEGYFVPLYHFHLTPVTNEQKVCICHCCLALTVCVHVYCYYVAVLIVCICAVWAPDVKTYFRKTKIYVNIPSGFSKQCANFQFKWSNVRVSGHHKLQENDAYLACKHSLHKLLTLPLWPNLLWTLIMLGSVKVNFQLKFKISECSMCAAGPSAWHSLPSELGAEEYITDYCTAVN